MRNSRYLNRFSWCKYLWIKINLLKSISYKIKRHSTHLLKHWHVLIYEKGKIAQCMEKKENCKQHLKKTDKKTILWKLNTNSGIKVLLTQWLRSFPKFIKQSNDSALYSCIFSFSQCRECEFNILNSPYRTSFIMPQRQKERFSRRQVS